MTLRTAETGRDGAGAGTAARRTGIGAEFQNINVYIRDMAQGFLQYIFAPVGKKIVFVSMPLSEIENAVGVITSVASYVPDPAEGAEVSADASFSLLKTLRKTGHLSKRFCGVLVDGCKKSVKTKSLTKGMKEIVVGMKGLFDGAGAARAAAIMKHVDDVDSLTAVSKMAKKAAEPTAILVRKHGAAGVDAIRELSKAEDGAEALAKAARKGPKGLKKILTYTKYGARTVKSVRLGHLQELAQEVARKIIENLGRLPMAIVSGLLALLGLLQTKVWRIGRIGCRQKPSAPPPASDAA